MKKIFGNNIILKLTFASLTAFLLFEEFYVFFIVKPTYTTSAKLQIGLKILHPLVVGMQIINVTGPDDYPDITLCPFPSYNQPNLLNHGYGHSFEYAKVSILFIVGIYFIHLDNVFDLEITEKKEKLYQAKLLYSEMLPSKFYRAITK